MRLKVMVLAALASVASAAYWMEEIQHQGVASFNPDKSYQVFRNVKAYGAKGDGVTDDTIAINKAISSGNRCGGGPFCNGTTTTPAVVYFPAGTYLVTTNIINYYYTQIIGDPTAMPVIKGSPNFQSYGGIGLIDSDPYLNSGTLQFRATNVFFRQIRNLVFDTTHVPGTVAGLHWPSSQATSIQNCVFKLSTRPEDDHTGIFMEEGSGGMLADLVFYGGKQGAQFGNQQYTMRNLTFYGSKTAIMQLWNWGWTYKSLNIYDCEVGINMSSNAVGSVTLLDSRFVNVQTAMTTFRGATHANSTGSLVVENVDYVNVPIVLQGPDGPLLRGNPSGLVHDAGYARGNAYTPNGPREYEDRDQAYFPQPTTLKQNGKFYERPKPQYESYPAYAFLSARSYGAVGDGITDDTAALNHLFQTAGNTQGSVAYIDAGYYKVTDTVHIPGGVRAVGEAMAAVILGAGPKFSDINDPQPVVQIGKPGEAGHVELGDIIVSTQGGTAGAVLIQYNLNPPAGPSSTLSEMPPSGLWDVHTRVGGFAGSNLQLADCLKTPDAAVHADARCTAAWLSFHVTKKAGNLYVENSWFWVADHDIEDFNNTQISVFAGRGVLVEGKRVWLVGTASEHHTLYQYQLLNATDVFMGQAQTETPYYQPNPPAPFPFTRIDTTLADPDFHTDCQSVQYGANTTINSDGSLTLGGNPACAMAWGLRILGSQNVVVFGAGLYSFFNNYNVNCSTLRSGENCQARIFWAGPLNPGSGFSTSTPPRDAGEGNPGKFVMSSRPPSHSNKTTGSTGEAADPWVQLYNLNTVGSVSMITRDGKDLAGWNQNLATFANTLALFHY
ncbi:pectate lyase superfamily protein-domain-containing protein [Copromyces sp. CBS 386.78]|nr:pectate lyase superfamily protein-domain-containing protein [Copromyces sp. CBS 386.78]